MKYVGPRTQDFVVHTPHGAEVADALIVVFGCKCFVRALRVESIQGVTEPCRCDGDE